MMANLSEDIQCAGSDTRPPMLDRSDFESWQQRIRLYCLGKENGENIFMSIDEGPFKMGKFRETLAEGALHLGPERDRVFADLTPEEKERFKADIRAMNILLQGLPKDIYTLINHYTDAKDIWDNVKMLLEGSELTKDERESQLYDDFEHFRQNKGETIHEYYVRFTKLINDMRNIKMTMPKMQLNSKFMNNMLPEWGRFVTAVKLNRGLKTSNYDQLYAYLKQHEAHANENKMMSVDRTEVRGTMQREQLEIGDFRIELAMQILNSEYFKDKMRLMQAQENGVVLDEEQLLFIAGGQTNTFDDDVDKEPVQDLALNEDHVFQADQCDAFDSDVYEAPTAQTMFMENLSSADPIYDEAGPSYDSDILSEVQDHDNYLDSVDEYQEYVKNNTEQVVQSNVSSVPNDSLMMIINDMHDHDAQCVSANEKNKVVNKSLTAELVRYKKQVVIYKKRARFELTEREQKIDEQMRIIITDRNMKEESLKKEFHSVKMQLNSTIDHKKSMKDEVATLKKDFKQKENKYLEDFLDMKALKEKVEDKLFKQDQSLQMTNHASAVVHDSKDTLELAERTRIGMLEKMKSPLWVESNIKIAPPDYSKENYLAIFTPQKQLSA
ncbi:hypothetical protein Tco_0364861 [Tanacetum coccineum]